MSFFWKTAGLSSTGLVTLLAFAIGLQFPSHPGDLTLAHFSALPLELVISVALLLCVSGWLFNFLRLFMVISLGALLLLRIADLGSEFALGRKFSPLAEWHLVGQGWSLASSTLGVTEAVLAVVVSVLALLFICYLLYRGLGTLSNIPVRAIKWCFAVLLSTAIAGQAYAVFGHSDSENATVRLTAVNEFPQRISAMKRQVQDQLEFQEMLQADKLGDSSSVNFAALEGTDVIVLFVESYGRSFIDHERFAERAADTLDVFGNHLSQAGLHVSSGWLDSPVRGGRSWLAHATLASGLPLTNHARFDRLMASDRRPLWSLLENAGWETAVVLPAVHDKWSESTWYSVDRFFNAPSMGYNGKDFGYVTMPDQYTLSAFEHKVRRTATRPLAAEVGLLSSHAPWTPLALPVDWDEIGDGSVFDGSQRFGEPWDWSNGGGPVREMYARSLELTMDIIGQYLARYADDALFIVVGDHQPASIIAGWAPNAHVPVHFVSENQALLDRLPSINFIQGVTPAAEATALSMADVRSLLSDTFSN